MDIPQHVDEKARLYFNNITGSIKFVFHTVLNHEAWPVKLYKRRLSTMPKDIVVAVKFTTDVNGFIAYLFSLKTSFYICEKLMPEIDNTLFDNDHLDIIGELGNMIAGNTISKLQSVDTDIHLSTPALWPFHQVLIMERDYWIFSSNIILESGKIGLMLGFEKQ